MHRQGWVLAGFILCACASHASEPRFEKPAEKPQQQVAEQQPKAAATAEADKAKLAPAAPAAPAMLQRTPTSPDPEQGDFSLAEATDGLGGKGALQASITTNLGALECTLYEDKAPNTVANFVGLARGKRPFWDAGEGAWVKRPLYDGTTFHRVIPGFMIQGGDYMGTGAGDIGYTIDDELHESLAHDRAGLLCMANKGPDTNGAQFFITDAPTPHLTRMKSYTIFGECTPTTLVSKIANAPKDARRRERPSPAVTIESVRVSRAAD